MKPHQMSDKIFNQVEIKIEMILCHLALYFIQSRQGLASYAVEDLKMTYLYYHKQRSIATCKTYKHTNSAKFVKK